MINWDAQISKAWGYLVPEAFFWKNGNLRKLTYVSYRGVWVHYTLVVCT